MSLSSLTQLNEPPIKVSGLQGEKAESLFVSPILEKTVKFSHFFYLTETTWA